MTARVLYQYTVTEGRYFAQEAFDYTATIPSESCDVIQGYTAEH